MFDNIPLLLRSSMYLLITHFDLHLRLPIERSLVRHNNPFYASNFNVLF